MLTRILLTFAVLALYALHQDVWNWRTARPLLFGFLPIGLTYHAGFCLAAAVLMSMLTRLAWPALSERSESKGPALSERSESQPVRLEDPRR